MATRSAIVQQEGSVVTKGLLAGGLVVGLVALLSGWQASQHWSASPEGIETFRALARGEAMPWWVPAHYWSSAVLLLTLGGALFVSFWVGDFRASRLRWWGGLLMLGGALLLQITGNAMPMDRHDVQTMAVESSIAARTPVVGPQIAELMMGREPGIDTVARWGWAHLWVGLPLFVLGMALVAGGLWTGGKGRASAIQWALTALPLAGLLALATMFEPARGAVFRPEDFTSFSAAPSWYVLPMHALLKLFDGIHSSLGWVGSALIPGLLAGLAAATPFLFAKTADRTRQAALLGVLGVVGVAMLAKGATPAPLWGDQPVARDTAPASTGGGAPIDANLAQRGRRLFDTHCAGCHGAGGQGGSAAPNVTTVFRRHADRAWYVEFIKNPNSKNPNSTMPAFGHLPEAEILAIAEWLRQPKGAAQAPTDAGGTTRTGAANTVQGDNDDGGRRRRGRGRGRSGGNGD